MDTNTTTTMAVQAAQTYGDMDSILLVILAAFLMLVMFIAGMVAARPSIPRARVRLRALEYYLEHGARPTNDAHDELVASLLRLDIRRLQERLGVDKEQD